MATLSVKYRPKILSEVLGQDIIVQILKRQIETNTLKNCVMLCGHSGTGKTTLARAIAYAVNKGQGSPIEIDGASNNGVDNVRVITEDATERSLDSEYKVYIIDECHMITTSAWNAFLKSIEEPPKYTIFIFCTTDLQKVPQTIINRCQVYTLNRINDNVIENRLKYICTNEGYDFDNDSLKYISKMANGSFRQAITYLDKCKDYSNSITFNNVKTVLGDYSYDIFFKLTDAVVDNNSQEILNIIETAYNQGTDLKVFISNYLSFVLQLVKFCLFKTLDNVDIPESYIDKLKFTVGIENNTKWFNQYVDKILTIKQAIKNDNDVKTTIEVMLLSKGV